MHVTAEDDPTHYQRWIVFAVIAGCYFFVYFHRVSTSVIADDLLRAFNTKATALGLMSSMYFYMYGLEQPIVGYLADRIGPRRVVACWSILAAIGSVLFGLAPSIGWACLGRALIGFGVGGVYVPALKAFSQWFRERDFATIIGLLLAVGNLGAVVATAPLAWLAQTWGWRSAFFFIGAVTFLLAGAVLLLTRDFQESSAGSGGPALDREKAGLKRWAQGLSVLISLRFWVLSIIFGGFFGAFLSFQGLWATAYLMSVYGMDPLRASAFNMLVPIGFLTGAPFFGRISDRLLSDKTLMLMAMLALEGMIWACLTFGWDPGGKTGMGVMFFLMGAFAGAFATAIWALVNTTTPKEIMGSVSGLLNTAPFFGVAVMQFVTGYLLDRVGPINGMYPPEAFRESFFSCFLLLVGCLTICVGFRGILKGRRHRAAEGQVSA